MLSWLLTELQYFGEIRFLFLKRDGLKLSEAPDFPDFTRLWWLLQIVRSDYFYEFCARMEDLSMFESTGLKLHNLMSLVQRNYFDVS